MFHAKDGLCFERIEDEAGTGDVRVFKQDSIDVLIPSNTWESIVAAMSAPGEQAAIQAAKALHRGIGFLSQERASS
jgi:hypothetical protein